MNTVFKKFNTDFFSKCKRTIKWFDHDGLFSMSKDRIVRITLDDVGSRYHYNGYMVEIINKHQGSILKKFFKFEEYLDMIHRPNSQEYCHVWYNGGKLEWYISKPTDTKQMTDKIFEWIDEMV